MDHGRARREGGGHQGVLGRHDGRLVHEEVARVEALGRRRAGSGCGPRSPPRRARGRRRGAGRGGAGRSRRRRAAACRRARGGRAAGRRAGTTRGCAPPSRSSTSEWLSSSAWSATTLSSRHSTFTSRQPQQLEHRLDVGDARDVPQHDLLARQERGGERRQCGVLVAGGSHGAREGRPAFDDELLHVADRSGARRGYPAVHGPADSRRSLAARLRVDASPTRSASTCSESRPRCAPTRGSSARTRSCGRATGLLHDLDYERYPDLGTGHPREALEAVRGDAATRRS